MANTVAESFEWRFILNDPVPQNAQPTSLNRLTSQLVIQGVNQDNAGTYVCRANFSDGFMEVGLAQLVFDGEISVLLESRRSYKSFIYQEHNYSVILHS